MMGKHDCKYFSGYLIQHLEMLSRILENDGSVFRKPSLNNNTSIILEYNPTNNNNQSHKQKMRQSFLTVLLLLFLLCPPIASTSAECLTYLQTLKNLSTRSPLEFLHKMTPYLILSGKGIDDLGFPQSCESEDNGYRYSTVEVSIADKDAGVEYTGYLGFCFVPYCEVDDLNQFAGFIIDYIFEEYEDDEVKGKFVRPSLNAQIGVWAIFGTILLIGVPVIVAMLYPISVWVGMCRKKDLKDSVGAEEEPKSFYIDLQNPAYSYPQPALSPNASLLQRLSLSYKWKLLFTPEKTDQIRIFSMFRIAAVPILIYGQIFWLTNFGAYNYYAFYEEIYEQFYVKLAMFSYYLPDIFLFISGYLLTQKHLPCPTPSKAVQSLLKKLLRLYPLYIVVFLLYWLVTPALGAGPVWYVYREEVGVCQQAWWRVLLLIDNWWPQSCYPILWFVQVQIQCTIIGLIILCIYGWRKRVGLAALIVGMIVGFGLMVGFEGEMLVSVKIAIDAYTEMYFKSLHSHIFFYLLGILFSTLSHKESLRLKLQAHLLTAPVLSLIPPLFSTILTGIILLRPWTWSSSSTTLSLELSLCRVGTMLAFILLALKGMFMKEFYLGCLHRYGYYMYGVVLVSYAVVAGGFWGVGSFMYVSGLDIINLVVPGFLVSYGIGMLLGLVFDLRGLTL